MTLPSFSGKTGSSIISRNLPLLFSLALTWKKAGGVLCCTGGGGGEGLGGSDVVSAVNTGCSADDV